MFVWISAFTSLLARVSFFRVLPDIPADRRKPRTVPITVTMTPPQKPGRLSRYLMAALAPQAAVEKHASCAASAAERSRRIYARTWQATQWPGAISFGCSRLFAGSGIRGKNLRSSSSPRNPRPRPALQPPRLSLGLEFGGGPRRKRGCTRNPHP